MRLLKSILSDSSVTPLVVNLFPVGQRALTIVGLSILDQRGHKKNQADKITVVKTTTKKPPKGRLINSSRAFNDPIMMP